MIKKIVLIFISWRALLFAVALLADKFFKFREGFDYVNGNIWANFDGIYYLYIAKAGYTVDNVGFFPLYPLLIKIFSLGENSIQFYVGIILNSVFFLLGLIMFYKLAKIDFSSKTAFLAILALLIFPTSFFFATIYTESLFLLLTISSLYFARKGNWVLASIAGLMLTATRLVGIAILPALLLEFYLQNKTLFSKKLIPILLTPLGVIAYSWFNFTNFANPVQFIASQGTLLNNRSVDKIILLPQTVFRYFNMLTSVSPSVYEWWIALLELSAFIFAAILLFVAWKKKIRLSYLAFSAIAFLIPTSSGTFTGLPRYILALFPIFLAIALINAQWFKWAYFVSGAILLIILFALFANGYYVA